MKTRSKARVAPTLRLPPPPPQMEDRVNDLGWLSRGPGRRADEAADRAIQHLLLRDGEESGLPPDPPEPPPLPSPPPQEPDGENRGGRPLR